MAFFLSAFFASTTRRVTVSTSESESSTGMVNRPVRRWSSGTLPAKAVWPAPISSTRLSSCLQRASATSCTSVERPGSLPMKSWISSSTITVQGICPSTESTSRTRRMNSLVEMSSTTGNCARSAARACFQVGGETGVGVEDGLGEDGADVEVVEFAEELLAGRFDRGLHPVEDAVLLEPHAELRLRQRLGQALGRKDDAQHGQADALAAARRQRPRRGVQAAAALAQRVEFAQKVLHFLREAGQAAGGRAVVEAGVHPQMAEHLQQVRLAAAVEAAHPRRRLRRRTDVAEVGLQDADQAVLVLALAHEVLKLVPERLDFLVAGGLAYGGNAVVQQLGYSGIALEELSVFH